MYSSASDRRKAENETIFRRANQKVQQGFENLKDVAASEGQWGTIKPLDFELQFFCECADENCHQRIKLRPDHYEKLHKDHKHFVIVPGHEAEDIERVVLAKPFFSVVEKHETPPKSGKKLNKTSVNNGD